MILTMQDLLNAGVNAFAVRLLAKDFEKMKGLDPTASAVHVAVPVSNGGTIWVSFSAIPPMDTKAPAPGESP